MVKKFQQELTYCMTRYVNYRRNVE